MNISTAHTSSPQGDEGGRWKNTSGMAEGRGFEPPRLITCRISSAVPSTTQPPLHKFTVLFYQFPCIFAIPLEPKPSHLFADSFQG